MGGWSDKSFGNDDAMDWLGELLEGGSGDSVRRTLETAADTGADEYLEVTDGAPAIAAAEVVAAAAGRPPARDSYNEGALDWADRNSAIGSSDMRALAQRAVLRVGADKSEFPQLWVDEADKAAWEEGLADLRARLD